MMPASGKKLSTQSSGQSFSQDFLWPIGFEALYEGLPSQLDLVVRPRKTDNQGPSQHAHAYPDTIFLMPPLTDLKF